MIAPARVAALRVCELVERGEATLPEALAQAQATLADVRDRALAAEIATGVFRWRAALDHIISAHITRPLHRLDATVLAILRVSAYQLLFLERVPARAVVSDAVSLTRARKLTSAGGFVNAVLRKIAIATSNDGAANRAKLLPPRDATREYLTVTLSHPAWLIDRWIDRYGVDAAEAWAQFDNSTAPLTLRANGLRITREELAARLAQLDIDTEPTRFAPEGLIIRSGHPLRTPLASDGLFVAQDEASQVIGWLAQVARTTLPHAYAVTALDACASPGGKTIALASAIGSSGGRIVAADRRHRRMQLLRDTMIATGATSAVSLVQLDLEAGLPFRQGFDLILVDAPCSGLGTLRREPEIRWRRTDADLARFAVRQQRMLHEATAGLRPGGLLIYSTCSSEPDENEAVAAVFLATHPEFRAVDPRDWTLPAPLVPLITEAGHLRTLPHLHGLEAFFAAVFARVA
jgi:16S rRNA (cytosine967-C5)-methyltransferase